MVVDKVVSPRFDDYIWDWDYSQYLLVGAYGSAKSYHTALKIILKCLQEKRKVLVIREVYDTHRESTFNLFCEILESMQLLAEKRSEAKKKVVAKESPFMLTFPNGSRVIFRGMDKPMKLKSINDVTIVWLEEAAEIKYAGYKELRGRLRHPSLSIHFLLTTNPVGVETWVFTHFFKFTDDNGVQHVKLDDERLYTKKTIVKNGVYYHHSVPEDNIFLTAQYIRTLEEMKEYDPDLYRVARHGRFGINGVRVLPQFVTAPHEEVEEAVKKLPRSAKFIGMDFGFEESYNAVIRLAVDRKNSILYIYFEYYKNKMTDDRTADELQLLGLQDDMIIADSAEPKAIQYYRQRGFKMKPCRKFGASRLANVRKVKRFKKIICSQQCPNCIRELSTLVYKKDDKGVVTYDEFNIDPHTFSAIWYGLDTVTVADVKDRKSNSVRGGEGIGIA